MNSWFRASFLVILALIAMVATRVHAAEGEGVTFVWGPEKATAANAAIMNFLGDPVPPPAKLDPKYAPEGLMSAFRGLCKKLNYDIQRVEVDVTEFPFLLYGTIEGRADYREISDALRSVPGYTYSGSSTGMTKDGATYFALNMMPSAHYPRSHVEAIRRRTMIRLQMLAATLCGHAR